MMAENKKTHFPYQIVIVDFLMCLFIPAINGLLCSRISSNLDKDPSVPLFSAFISGFILIACFFIFYIYLERKYNHLKKKNIFLLVGAIIALTNLIAILVIPNKLVLPNNVIFEMTAMKRVYYILAGFGVAILPYVFFYLIPRRILSHRYLNFVLKLAIYIIFFFIALSFIIDRDTYASLFANHFRNLTSCSIHSVFGGKNAFGRALLAAIFASIFLHYRTKNWKWSLCIVPLFFFLVLTMSKMAIFLGIIVILTHIIIWIVLIAKKSKDNLIITLLCSSFVLLLLVYFFTMVGVSTAGKLFRVKSFFIDFGVSTSNTFASRKVIWDCALKMLQPYQYVFGFGQFSFGPALHFVYLNDPLHPVWEATNAVWEGHNIAVELIGRGGAILLGLYLLIYAYLIHICIKTYRKRPLFCSLMIFAIFIFIIDGLIDSNYLCLPDEDMFTSMILILPVISEYYISVDQREKNIRKDFVEDAKKIKSVNFKSRFLSLNKKCILLEAKYIAYDLNNKIRL